MYAFDAFYLVIVFASGIGEVVCVDLSVCCGFDRVLVRENKNFPHGKQI